MTRETKFRAWDKLNYKWLDLFQLAFAKDGAVMAVNTLDGETYGLHQVDLVEYTGLKDKNGKEIFEGDVVKYNHAEVEWSDANSCPMFVGVIEWWGGFRTLDSKSKLQDAKYHINNQRDKFQDIIWSNMEVIGNICENPELLEVKE